MKTILSSILGAVLLGDASLSAAGEIDVMTQNQYLGADLTPVWLTSLFRSKDQQDIRFLSGSFYQRWFADLVDNPDSERLRDRIA